MRQADATLVTQLADDLARRIDEHGLRPGTRLPSIRRMAEQSGVSRFTVVEAYDRLVARGLVQSRHGAGFFVRARSASLTALASARVPQAAPETPVRVDVSWLLRNMFRETAAGMPGGAGLLPPEWLDPDMVAAAVRAVGRTVRGNLVSYGSPQGYAPLRQQLASMLQADGVPAHPERNLLTTNGVTHGLDIVARHLIKPGDTVLVEDPAWFVIFGRLAAFGARPVGVPRGPDGPDLAMLDRLAAEHKPRLYIINGAVHNPIGHTLSAGAAYDILRLAERHDFMVVEDDTYADLHPGGAMKLAALDRLERVILVGGFSKMLAASLRVGYIAAGAETLQRLTDLKMLAGLTSPELGERVVHRVLVEGQYQRHIERVRARVNEARLRSIQALQQLGLSVPHEPHAGMFVWADCGRDSEPVARNAAERGMLLAPGTLFSPSGAPSTMLRFSVAMVDTPGIWQSIAAVMAQ
ncbi:PLP-dependent aminotransferase family protein [Bordetella pertussis]|uniref:GntR-family transcriptional regulator n=18 Tax=Bordetella pertussis TaxID=520 RepID=Q7VSK2_BORPE|nr:PLP-dependent aminotransferase family protein [Bordetella pertussis]ETH39628.1 transcriptional regulator, GntR family [Bordetella pertussis H918]ETH43019.1 transcriptional regulator, GntR family [Bordetella pertussis H939]ETH47053.1 transcriptional regulator, GntR family [Bordetella pertussis H921]ETH70286.1 transcriptional regulator, GntR family [Bordetella pertussis STO1-CHLA-0011]ETH84732.1 transcriptional regulator, GntR family [Bordetella pertussis STO1-CHOC-0017]ETH85417.1 transcript